MKKGFTLAEVLVTLGIIGVVAALTTPALIQNVGNAKIAPRLQKAKATWEVAAEMLLNDENSNTIWGVAQDSETLGRKMSKFMKITRAKHSENGDFDYNYYNGQTLPASHVEFIAFDNGFGYRYDSDEGMIYYISVIEKHSSGGYKNTPNNQLIGKVVVDINGKQTPNVLGKDAFAFELYNDGTLRPWGGKGSGRNMPISFRDEQIWSTSDEKNACNDETVTYGWGCAGSIFDNGMKIIYQ